MVSSGTTKRKTRSRGDEGRGARPDALFFAGKGTIEKGLGSVK